MLRDEIRSRFREHSERPVETTIVKAFGAEITLRKLSYEELQEARAGGIDGEQFNNTKHLLAMLVISAKDEAGNAVFEKSDLMDLLAADASEMDRLIQAALKLNRLTEQDHTEGKEGSPATGAGGAS